MIAVDRAAVVGLGLIGGSIARELAARGIHVSGFDADPRGLRAAMRAGVVETSLDPTLAGVRDAELIVLAVPVDAAVNVLEHMAPHVRQAKLVTDVGSTKSRIVAAASRLELGERFVGSHPLAGDHRSGWQASRTGLFTDARVYLCPPNEARPETIAAASALWTELGARPAVVRAEDHDRQLAWTSHLPQLMSNALALALARQGVARGELGPGGRDVTRLAGSSPEMWAAVAEENAPALDDALAAAERALGELREAIAQRDVASVRARLAEARRWFDG